MLNLVGINTGAGAEVETATQALRVTQRALDVSSGGSFRLTSRSGIMAAGLAANSPVYAMRNASGTLLTVVNRIRISAWSLGTAFAVGLGTAELYRATAWTAADTGGVTDVITTVQGKLRTTFNSIASLAEIRHSATATLSAGTRTLDSQPMEALNVSVGTVANTPFIPIGTSILSKEVGEYPLVLAQNEGLVIQMTVPATGTWSFAITAVWDEVTSYAP